MKQSKHGTFEVSIHGNLLHLRLEGTWNLETALAYREAFKQAVKQFDGIDWAAKTCLNNWELCTPDCEDIFVDLVCFGISRNAIREAVVSGEGSVKTHFFNKHKNVPVDLNKLKRFERRFFTDDETATRWLAEQGFPL